MPTAFVGTDFEKLLNRSVIVRLSSGTTTLGTLKREGRQLFLTQIPPIDGFIETATLAANDVTWIRSFPGETPEFKYLDEVAGELTDFKAVWSDDGRSVEWFNVGGSMAELAVEPQANRDRFAAFLTLEDPDREADSTARNPPETRHFAVSTESAEAARIVRRFLEISDL